MSKNCLVQLNSQTNILLALEQFQNSPQARMIRELKKIKLKKNSELIADAVTLIYNKYMQTWFYTDYIDACLDSVFSCYLNESVDLKSVGRTFHKLSAAGQKLGHHGSLHGCVGCIVNLTYLT